MGARTHDSLNEAGKLPGGVSLTDNSNGTATLHGSPSSNSVGTYKITLTATNSVGSTNQAFTLTVGLLPAITSAASATLTVGKPGSFTITATGYPTAVITKLGALPSGVTFVDNRNGTATVAGTPAAGTSGTSTLTLTAANSAGTTSQAFTLTVRQVPVITSLNAATFTRGKPGRFSITTTGFPMPVITQSGKLPAGLTFTDNHNGTATLGGTPNQGIAGSYKISITVSNSAGSTAQTFTLTIK